MPLCCFSAQLLPNRKVAGRAGKHLTVYSPPPTLDTPKISQQWGINVGRFDLPDATIDLRSEFTLIFLFKLGLSRSNLIFFGGASDD